MLELHLVCGRCGLPASALITFNCPRCGADVREVGIGRQAGGAGPARAIVRWTLLVATIAAAILITLESIKYYERHQQHYLATIGASPGGRGGIAAPRLEATFTATGAGFSKNAALDEVNCLLAGPGGQRTLLWVDAASMRYATLDSQLQRAQRPGRLTHGLLLITLQSIGLDPTDPATKQSAAELMAVIAAAHAGDMGTAATPSFRSRGGGAGYGAGANRTMIAWTWFAGLILWIAGVIFILRRQQRIRVSPTTGAA